MSIKIPSWEEYFMRHVYLAASKSKDESTQIGAVLVRDGSIVSEGYNGLCRKVNDNVPERQERPEKYFWFEHGERNAIYNAARHGVATLNCDMYTQGIPCADCARAVIQAGVRRLFVHTQWDKRFTNAKWEESCARSSKMLEEAGVEIIQIDIPLGVECLRNGEPFKV